MDTGARHGVIDHVDGPNLELRPAAEDDRELLFRVYASTRAEELSVTGWPDATIEGFLRQQFATQDHYYRANFPDATFEVIVVDGEPAGRLYLHDVADETRIIDIAVLPRFQGRGVGTRLVREVLAAAGARGACVTIHVERNNPALAWYRRLGFVLAQDGEPYLFLRCEPAGGGA